MHANSTSLQTPSPEQRPDAHFKSQSISKKKDEAESRTEVGDSRAALRKHKPEGFQTLDFHSDISLKLKVNNFFKAKGKPQVQGNGFKENDEEERTDSGDEKYPKFEQSTQENLRSFKDKINEQSRFK